MSVCSAVRRCAVLAAERLDLVVVARPHVTGESGRRSGTELGSARHQPRLALRPLGDNRDDGRHVDAGGGVRPIAFPRGGAIIGAQREDRRRGLFPHRDACGLRRAIGDGGQCGLVGGVDRGLLRRDELRQRGAVCRRDRGIDRRTRRRVQFQLTGWIALGNGVDGFVDGRLDERHHPVGRWRPQLGSDDDIAGRDVPVGDHIGLRHWAGEQ